MNVTLGTVVAGCLFASLALCAGGQVIHGCLRYIQSGLDSRKPIVVYETAIVAHLLAMAIAAYLAMRASPGFPQGFADAYLGWPMPAIALWVNAPVAAALAYATLQGVNHYDDYDSFSWMPATELVVACLSMPLLPMVFDELWTIALVADGLYFLYRTFVLLRHDRRLRNSIVSALSIVESIRRMPEGLLCVNASGKVILANDTMRRCLAALDVPGDITHPDQLWQVLNEKASTQHAVHVGDSAGRDSGSWVTLKISDDEIRLFSFECGRFSRGPGYSGATSSNLRTVADDAAMRLFGDAPYSLVIAYDVTQEMQALAEIEAATAELESSQHEIQESIATVREAAENEALLKMRGRVHDVIGQRLSMLHRALEDGGPLNEKIDQMKPLLNSILADLSEGIDIQPADELAATADAFALAGVNVRIAGELPDDPDRARLFADCVREGTTNAVKHAHARTVDVTLSNDGFVISNDGMPPKQPVRYGTGLTNMQASLEADGATFEVSYADQLFTLSVRYPG